MSVPEAKAIIDEINEICDKLQHKANIKQDDEIAKARAYHDGYYDACEDYRKNLAFVINTKKLNERSNTES